MPEIKLTVDRNGNGIRYRKMVKGKVWKSKTYGSDTRDNRREATKAFQEWKDQQESVHEPKPTLEKLLKKQNRTTTETQEMQEQLQERLSKAQPILEAAGMPEDRQDWSPHHWSLVDAAAHLALNREIRTKSIEPSFETSKLIEQWLGFRLQEARAGEITIGTVDNNRRQVSQFANFSPDIRDANNLKFTEFRASLLAKIGQGESQSTHRDTISTVKKFLEWCGDIAQVIPPLTVLRKRGTGIKVPTKKTINVWTDEAVKKLIRVTSGQQCLYYLLILNTGCYESDIGNFTKANFDKKKKTLTFKRHKEQGTPNVPTVTYPLWAQTVELLEECQSDHPELLLTSSNDTPLWIDEEKVDTTAINKRKRKNVIGRQFGRLKKKHEEFGTLEDLRKTVISKFDNHGEYSRYAQHFAGHAPQGTTDRFYRKPSQEQFNQAVLWLGEQFGQ